jgi:hypothetical protein
MTTPALVPSHRTDALAWSGVADLVGHVPGSLLASPWIARLAGVSFLGALEAAPGCVERSSRLDHSIGAARLALGAAKSMRLAPEPTRLLVTAAFLHDIGHWPFSHSAEAGFDAALGADHHALSRWILLGGGPIPRSRSLAPILEDAGLDPQSVLALIEGEVTALDDDARALLAPLLSAALNVDTLEGISRAARAFGVRGVRLPASVFTRRGERLTIPAEAVPAIDRFWRLKDRVYRDVINSAPHAAFELRFASDVGRRLDPSLLSELDTLDDAALRSRRRAVEGRDSLPAPKASDRAARYVAAADPSSCPTRWLRRYRVNHEVRPGAQGLGAEDWSRRWTSKRERWFLVGAARSLQLLLPCLQETEGAEL